ncbi:MAG TPA: biotin transporter BioY [Terriglobia bacterium]|nr:biotin transporter BioY [Terriglobia bacterium]
MTRISSPVLVDNWSRPRAALDLMWVAGFSLLTAVLAQVRIPLPFTPVPLTGQTFAVLLAGAALGSRRGFLSQALYLVEGAAGLPVFAGGAAGFTYSFGPTGGYLWSYPLAAALVGWLVERGASRNLWRLTLALALSTVLILLSGTLWLHRFVGQAWSQAWLAGFYPFLPGDLLKIALVGTSLPQVLKRLAPSGK